MTEISRSAAMSVCIQIPAGATSPSVQYGLDVSVAHPTIDEGFFCILSTTLASCLKRERGERIANHGGDVYVSLQSPPVLVRRKNKGDGRTSRVETQLMVDSLHLA